MKRYDYICDSASLKILADGGEILYFNHFGDGIYDVYICRKKDLPMMAYPQGKFIIVKEGWLMKYDCSYDDKDKQHKFSKGGYSVYLDYRTCTFFICKKRRKRKKCSR